MEPQSRSYKSLCAIIRLCTHKIFHRCFSEKGRNLRLVIYLKYKSMKNLLSLEGKSAESEKYESYIDPG